MEYDSNQNVKKIIKVFILIAVCVICTIIFISSTSSNDNIRSVKSFVKGWNENAKNYPSGVTNGIKISEKQLLNNTKLELGNGSLIEVEISDNQISGLNLYDSEYATYKNKIEGIIDIVYEEPPDQYYEDFNDRYNKLTAPELATGIQFVFGNYFANIYPIYPYISTLQKYNGIGGLCFGIDLEQYCKNYNYHVESLYQEKQGYKSNVTDSEYINCARILIKNQLKAPLSAVWGDAEVIERDAYGRACVVLTVDAQNSFGAMIRNQYCVIIEGVYTNDQFSHKENAFCTIKSLNDTATIEVLKLFNCFGMPQNDASYIQSDEFAIEAHGKYIIYSNTVDFGTLKIYTDNDSKQIIGICFYVIKDLFNTSEDATEIERLINTIWESVSKESIYAPNISNLVDYDNMSIIKPIYSNGLLFEVNESEAGDCFVFNVVTMLESNYKNGQTATDILNDNM